MIKIPVEKYINSKMDLVEEHFDNIKNYIIDVIQFYINCCGIIDQMYKGCIKSKHEYKKYDENLYYVKDKTILKGLMSVLSNVKFEEKNNPTGIKNIEDVFEKDKIKTEFKDNCNDIREILEDFLDKSSDIRKWSAYDLCEKLNVNVCPYCNRIYTFTVRKIADATSNKKNEIKDIVRPQLDHYFPQSKYPIFALSFYNLIPSCSICNSSIKGSKDLSLNNNLHPYLDSLDENYIFDYKILNSGIWNGDKDSIKVIVSNKIGDKHEKSENNLDFFKIEDIYSIHNDVVTNLVYKRVKYTDSRLEEIEEMFKLNGKTIISKEELFDDIFHKPKENEIIDTSLGKLYRDIIEQLENYY